jgi:very-short-patch-repair endonuclease
MRRNPHHLIIRSRQLRREQTDAERFLWETLRDRRFEGFRFRRQFIIGHYVVDFYCVKARLIIELDGGQHNLDANINYDESRTRYLQSQNIKVLRFWNNDVFLNTDAVLETIYSYLHAPSP